MFAAATISCNDMENTRTASHVVLLCASAHGQVKSKLILANVVDISFIGLFGDSYQIDYITINNRFRNSVQQSKSYPGADCGSDHNPVICKLKVRLEKLKMIKREQQLDYCQLQNNQDINNIYAIEVKNRFSVLEQEGNNTTWEVFKEALVEKKETIPKKTKQSKNKWMTEEILRMMRRRQAIPQRNSDEYK